MRPMDGTSDAAEVTTVTTGRAARAWFALLRRLGRGISGRRFTVRGTTFHVRALHGRPDGSWSLGRVRDAHAVLVDVEGPDLTAREVVVTCETLTVGSTVTATGVSVTATLAPEAVRAMIAEAGASGDFDVVDGELRSRWFPGVDVVVRPMVGRDRLWFVPVAMISPAGRWPAPWLPSVTAPPPELPGGLRLVDIGTTDDAVVLRATADEWTASPRERLRDAPAVA